jgi:hypothetical protein
MAKHIGNIVGSASSDPPPFSISTSTNSAIWNKQEQFYFSKKSSWPGVIVNFVIELWGAKGTNAACAGGNGGYNKTEIATYLGQEFTIVTANGRPGFTTGGLNPGAGGGSSGIAAGPFPSPVSKWLVVAGGGGGGGGGNWQCSPGGAGLGTGSPGDGPTISNGGVGGSGNGPGGGGGGGVPGGGGGGIWGENDDGGGGGGGGYGGARASVTAAFPEIVSLTIQSSSNGSYSGLGSARITYNGITTSYSSGINTSFRLW